MNQSNGTRHGKAGIVVFFLVVCAAFSLWAPKAEAVSGYLSSFATTYPAATTLSSSCLICHTTANASPSTRNPYGSAYGSGHNFAAIETADSDGDGFTNITEINANTYPGNAASFPAGTNTAPVAVNDSYSVAAGAILTVNAATGVLGNDTDAQSNPLTAVLVAAPSSGTLNLSSNGSFTYTPTIASGSVTFTYRANDGSLDSASAATVTITVSAATAAGPMTVTPAGGLTSTGTAGGPFSPPSQSFTLTNTGGSPMNWTATNAQSWVTLSSAGGTLAAGANTTVTASINAGANSLAAGSYGDNVTFTNTSSGTGNATRPVSLTVNATNTAGPMTVTPAGGLTSSGTAGGPFTPPSQTYTVTNTGTASMNWTATKVQSWVTLSSAGGTLAAGANTTVIASINSGANSLAVGGYGDNVTFTNTSTGTGNTTRPVSLTVNATAAPTISTAALPAGAVNTAYSQTLTAAGGTTPYSWTVSAGTLPAGLTLSAAGVLSGTPTTAGSASFTVRVAGANSASSTKDFSVTINAAEPVPVTLSSDSGGSCSVAARTGSGGSYIDGTLILAGLGLTVWGIRIRRRRE